MSWTLLTSGSAIAKAGSGESSTIIASGTTLQRWADEAEGEASDLARFDVVSNYGSLTTEGKKILEKFCSAHVAQNIINYDMSGYPSVGTAITMLNLLENQKTEAKTILTDKNFKDYLGITST